MADFRGELSCNQNVLKDLVLDPLASAPSSPVAGQTYFNTVSKFLYYFDGTNWVQINGSTNVSYDYILLQDQKTSGTAGSIYSSNGWRKLNLNTIAHDDTGSVTVSSNNFTLPAGTYEISARSPFIRNGGGSYYGCRLRLYNETDTAVILYGQSFIAEIPSPDSTLIGKFSISASKTLSIYLYPVGSNMTNQAAGITGVSEIYTQVELRKVV
jgi:hypothetical protein